MITKETRVLVVDDLDLVRRVLRQTLNDIGLQSVDEANDAQNALAKIQAGLASTPYGLIFLDWNMPGMSGLELLQLCRAKPEMASIPIVMVTAEAEKKHVLKALTSGATDYIVKPFSTAVLTAKIKHINESAKSSPGGNQ